MRPSRPRSRPATACSPDPSPCNGSPPGLPKGCPRPPAAGPGPGGGLSLALAARSRDELQETRSQSGLPHERALIVLVDLATEDAPDLLIGKDWVVYLSPEYVAGKHQRAAISAAEIEPRLKEILAKDKK